MDLMSPGEGDFQNDAEGPGDVEWNSRVMFLNNKLKAGTNWKESYISYGNEASIGYLYATGILVMHVMPWEVNGSRRAGWDIGGRRKARAGCPGSGFPRYIDEYNLDVWFEKLER